MKKGVLLFVLLGLSGVVHSAGAYAESYTGPDCSNMKTDNFFRIVGGITDSLDIKDDKKINPVHEKYFEQLMGKGVKRKITRLSSEKISKDEAVRLMMRRAKMDGFNSADIEDSGIKVQYLDTDLYKQYYLIESSKGFKAIAEYYTAVASKGKGPVAVSCGADLENIYIISDNIFGHTEDFATR